MRGKKLALNAICSLLQEVVAVICGFILPRLILSAFGSKYNGLIASITQFLSCAVLLRSGLGGVTRAALYRPLAQHDNKAFCGIVNATDRFMKKIGLILAGMIVIFAMIYPMLVKNEFGWLFTFSLVLIIGASTFAESFFGITYLIVLQADQKLWISSLLSIVCTILNTVICAVLIYNHASIHLVKAASSIVFVLYPIVMGAYVRRKYKIDKSVAPDNSAISQRWDAFWHQISVFVMNNTDVMILTIFTNMLEVSVYSVYNMVIHGLKRVIISLSGSQEAAFGNMIAKREYTALQQNVSIVENIMFGICTAIYACTSVLILDFVRLYTNQITDVNYHRPVFAIIIIIANFFNGVRLPYQAVVEAAGDRAVTVKIRSGWEKFQITWKEAAQAALEAGASAITIHPRTRAQGYEGHSDWSIMKELVEYVGEWNKSHSDRIPVPVFGSGDLFKPEDAKKMLEETGADAVMFARGAMGNPFIFRDATSLLQTGSYEPLPPDVRIKTGFAELERLVRDTEEKHACMEMRKRFAAYSKGIHNGAALRLQIVHASTVEDYKKIFQPVLQAFEEENSQNSRL